MLGVPCTEQDGSKIVGNGSLKIESISEVLSDSPSESIFDKADYLLLDTKWVSKSTDLGTTPSSDRRYPEAVFLILRLDRIPSPVLVQVEIDVGNCIIVIIEARSWLLYSLISEVKVERHLGQIALK